MKNGKGGRNRDGQHPTIDPAIMKQWILERRKFRVIDIRSPEQHAAGRGMRSLELGWRSRLSGS